MKKILSIFLSIVMIVPFAACGNKDNPNETTPQKTSSVASYCWESVENYTINPHPDGSYTVTLEGPDVSSILINYLSNNDCKKLTDQQLLDIIQSNANQVKTYSFTIMSTTEENISEAFQSQIQYDLIKASFESLG